MSAKRKYTNSQMLWLAENLSGSQMDFLMENDATDASTASSSFPILDPTKNINPNGAATTQVQQVSLAEQPQNNSANQQQNAQTQQQQQQQPQNVNKDNKNQVLTVCKAMKSGKLNKIEPSQMKKFMEVANISASQIGAAIKYAIDFLGIQMKKPKEINMETFKNTVAGINNCLAALSFKRNAISESVFTSFRQNGFEPNDLPMAIHIDNIAAIKKAAAISNTINESNADSVNIRESVKEFFDITAQIKSLTMLAENAKIDITTFKNLQDLTKGVNSKINENMSAIKYANALYNKKK